MKTNREIHALLFCCLLLQMAEPARAQLEGKIFYPKFYKYHTGDDIVWAQPEFDDGGWDRMKFDKFPFDRWPGIGWLRYDLEVDSTLWNVPLALSMDVAGAVEFYLDGELVHRIGKVGATAKDEVALMTMVVVKMK